MRELTEKEMILRLMKTACQKQNGCSLDEFVQSCRQEFSQGV